MRSASWLKAVFLVACGSSSSSSVSPDDFPDDHAFHNDTEETERELRVHLGGKQIPLSEMPGVAKRIGLPVSGTADVAVAMTVPKVGEDTDYTKAVGSWAISCTHCQAGDDKSKLDFGTHDFIGGGIDVSHLTVDRLQVNATVADGRVELTTWQFASPDLDLDVALTVKLAPVLFDSTVDGCIRFKPSKALEARDPKLYSLLALTGAAIGRDGRYQIKLEGPLNKVRRLAKECGR